MTSEERSAGVLIDVSRVALLHPMINHGIVCYLLTRPRYVESLRKDQGAYSTTQ